MPDTDALVRLIETVAPAVEVVFVFLNSRIDGALREVLDRNPSVSVIDAERNLGIGVGLNLIVLAALLRGCESIVLFDQDSRPSFGTVGRLGDAVRILRSAGANPAVVAPCMVADPRSPESKPPSYRFRIRMADIGPARAVAFVPTSGSLISLAVFRSIGLFRADYFIDGIDLEWSFRAWASGYSCWIVPDCPMPHPIGSGIINIPFLGRSMPNQRPFRMYCTIRNALYGLRLDHIPWRWKVLQLGYLPFQMLAYAAHHRFRAAVLQQLAAGVFDGLRGRLGVPATAPDGRD